MKKFLKRFWKNHKKDLFSIVLLTGLTFYAWRFFLDWIIQAQGFMYFDPRTLNTYLSSFLKLLTTAQVAGVLMSSFLVKLVGVNMFLYMVIQVLIMISIAILFYCVVTVITKSRFASFSAALIYAVSYFGNFDMYVIDYSDHLLERASLNVVFLLLSFMFLHLFLKKSKQKFYVISIILSFFGVLFSHFSIIFTAPYFFYLFFWYLFNKKNVLKGLILGTVFLLISGFFTYLQSIGMEPLLRHHVGFIEFFSNPGKYCYFEGALMELVYWSQYQHIIKAIIGDMYPLSFFTYQTAISLKIPVIITYLIATIVIYKTFIKQRALLFTTIFGAGVIFLVNMYLGRYNPFYTAGTSRYLYFPTFLLAIFWALFLLVLFKNRKLLIKILAIFILVVYYYANTYLIFIHFSRSMSDAMSQKATYKYIIKNSEKFPVNTIVLAKYPDIAEYEGPFFTSQLGKGKVRYMSALPVISEWQKHASSAAHVIMLNYDNDCRCIKEEVIK